MTRSESIGNRSEGIFLDWEFVPGVWLKQDPNDGREYVEIALPEPKLDAVLFGCRDQFRAIMAELDEDAIVTVAWRNNIEPGQFAAILPSQIDEVQSRIVNVLVLRAVIDEHLATADKRAPFIPVIDYALNLAKQGRQVYSVT